MEQDSIMMNIFIVLRNYLFFEKIWLIKISTKEVKKVGIFFWGTVTKTDEISGWVSKKVETAKKNILMCNELWDKWVGVSLWVNEQMKSVLESQIKM